MLVLEPDYHRFATDVLELRLHFCHLGIKTPCSTTILKIMAWFTHSSGFAILALALTLGPALTVSAQPTRSSTLGNQLERAFRPPRRGIAINRQGGATRNPDSCFVGTRQLTALVPTTVGETAAEYPTVFWYMPMMSAENAPSPELEFTLKDAGDKDNKIYSVKYPLNKSTDGLVSTPGIMSLTLAKPLQVDKEYTWQLKVTCDATDNSDAKFVVGSLKRVKEDPNLAIRVQQATPEERVVLYANANRWYEMLANLVALRRSRPNDPSVTDAWNKLFAVVELDEVSIQSRSQSTGSTNNSN